MAARSHHPATPPYYKNATVINNRDKNYHIIVADDDDDDQYLITEALRETVTSHSVKTVNNGMELVELLFSDNGSSHRLPDFILLDLNMPLLDGYSVLQQVRSNETTKAIPVFVLSTSRFDHDRERSKELGANGFYSKPYHYDELKSIIRDICAESLS